MTISPKIKVREVADEHIVLLQGKNPGDMTTVVSLNETSLFLWNKLVGTQFETEDVVKILMDNYDVDSATAERDAKAWLDELKKNNLLS